MNEHTSCISLAREQAADFGEKSAYIFLANGEHVSETLTYSELDLRARALAARLPKLFSPGDRGLLVYHSCIENIVSFFGCIYAGLIAVPVCPPHRNRRNTRFDSILEDCTPSLALSTTMQIA